MAFVPTYLHIKNIVCTIVLLRAYSCFRIVRNAAADAAGWSSGTM